VSKYGILKTLAHNEIMTRTLTGQPPARRGTQDTRPETQNPGLRIFIEAKHGVSADEVFQKADEAGLIVASNKQLSRILVGSEGWKIIKTALPCWSGTMTGYVEPGRTFREGGEELHSISGDYRFAIIYADNQTGIRHIFPIPREYEEEKDAILVTEHPNFIVKEGNDRIVQTALVDVVRGFPVFDGWHLGDPKYDIPSGSVVERSDLAARYLFRIAKRVGPVARGFCYYGGYWRGVGLGSGPSGAFGVAVVEREPAPRVRFEEPNGADPYRSAPRVIEDNEPETGNRTHDTRPETQDQRPGFLRRLSLAIGFG
jgi:hypothetical protein